MPDKSELEKAFEQAVQPGADLIERLSRVRFEPVQTPADAHAICRALDHIAAAASGTSTSSQLHMAATFFQAVKSEEVFQVLFREGIPRLIQVFDEQWQSPKRDLKKLPFVLKIFAMFRHEDATRRIIHAAHEEPEGYMWPLIFAVFDKSHPFRQTLCEALRDPLPTGFLGYIYLGFVNKLARAGDIDRHPFDTPAGKARLHEYLSSSPAKYGHTAHDATAALPFISNPERDEMLALAMDHPEADVQMEAAWAAARLGSEGGVKYLARLCQEPRSAKRACRYLVEVGRADAIPAEAREPDFLAMAEMCSWLAHPHEFGKNPDEITLYDTRVLFWPPTNDRRRVWLFKYLYRKKEDVGLGMVGSVTFALFGETAPSQSPEDAYALHCCFELQENNDPGAPKERSVAAGREILDRYQKE